MPALPHGAAETVPQLGVVPEVHHRVAGQERREVRRHADRPHARAAAAVRDAEGLVQVQVADVGADVARAAEADLRVHVGAVHVDLPAVLVHDRGRSRGCPTRRRRASTDRSPSARPGCRECSAALARRSSTSMLPGRVALHRHHLHARHHRAGGVGAVRRHRDQADRRGSWRRGCGDRRGSPAGPAYSPCEPALGCSDTAAKPVISASWSSSWRKSSW